MPVQHQHRPVLQGLDRGRLIRIDRHRIFRSERGFHQDRSIQTGAWFTTRFCRHEVRMIGDILRQHLALAHDVELAIHQPEPLVGSVEYPEPSSHDRRQVIGHKENGVRPAMLNGRTARVEVDDDETRRRDNPDDEIMFIRDREALQLKGFGRLLIHGVETARFCRICVVGMALRRRPKQGGLPASDRPDHDAFATLIDPIPVSVAIPGGPSPILFGGCAIILGWRIGLQLRHQRQFRSLFVPIQMRATRRRLLPHIFQPMRSNPPFLFEAMLPVLLAK